MHREGDGLRASRPPPPSLRRADHLITFHRLVVRVRVRRDQQPEFGGDLLQLRVPPVLLLQPVTALLAPVVGVLAPVVEVLAVVTVVVTVVVMVQRHALIRVFIAETFQYIISQTNKV